MARNPPKTNFADEPSIIIDPSLYVPEQRWLLQTVCETFIDVSRVLMVITVSGGVAFGGAQIALSLPDVEQPAAHAQSAPQPAVRSEALRVAMDLQPAPAAPFASETCRASAGEPSSAALAGVCSEAKALAAAEAPPAPKSARTPHDIAGSVRAARRLLALNRLEDAEAAYRRVLVADERQPAALLGLARVHLARGQLDEALVFAERAVEFAPHQAGGHLTLGDVLRARGARARADTHYELAVQLNVKPGEVTEQPKQL